MREGKAMKAFLRCLIAGAIVWLFLAAPAGAGMVGEGGTLIDTGNPDEVSTVLEIAIVMTILALAPAILVLTTSFTRIVVVLSFLRRALSTQQLPPNQVIIGLSLLLAAVTMTPTWTKMYNAGIGPYMNREISIKEGLARAERPMREFMFRQTRISDIELMLSLSKTPVTDAFAPKDVPTHTLIAAFVISELTRAFTMGFILYLPFVIIDLIISTTLISMGMLVLPPILISLPFKILLFVLVDGWALVVKSMVASFY